MTTTRTGDVWVIARDPDQTAHVAEIDVQGGTGTELFTFAMASQMVDMTADGADRLYVTQNQVSVVKRIILANNGSES